MKVIPELRTCNIKLTTPLPLNEYDNSHTAVCDEDGKLVGVFFGKYAESIALFTCTFTDAMKLAYAQRKLETATPEVPTEAVSNSDSLVLQK